MKYEFDKGTVWEIAMLSVKRPIEKHPDALERIDYYLNKLVDKFYDGPAGREILHIKGALETHEELDALKQEIDKEMAEMEKGMPYLGLMNFRNMIKMLVIPKNEETEEGEGQA